MTESKRIEWQILSVRSVSAVKHFKVIGLRRFGIGLVEPQPSRASHSAEDTPAGVSIANQIARIITDMVINFALQATWRNAPALRM